jgi:2-alkenal reductase
MKTRAVLFSVLLVSALLLGACSSGASLALTGAGLAANNATQEQAQVVAPVAQVAAPVAQNLASFQDTFEQLYNAVNPSVVNIQVIAGGNGFSGGSGEGSGFVWDKQGHIVTNAHVVDSAANGAAELSVIFSDGAIVPAELVGADTYSDLAVIKVDVPATELQPVTLVDSNQVKVGQIAIAIGNPFGLQGTMTQGIISGLARTLDVDLESPVTQSGGRYSIPDIIQTDASINPGNSGGVLIDIEGKVIGVTSAIASASGSNSGVGFVIPANIVKKYVPDMIAAGKVEHSWMGISGTTLDPEIAEAAGLGADQKGVVVLTITSGSPAQKAGLRAASRQASVSSEPDIQGADVIVAIDGKEVTRFEDMVSYLYNSTDPGQTITLTVLRGGSQQSVRLTLGVLPD